MAEVTRRSFDLKSWQGLTEVLKVARESQLAPDAYAEFRNLVLEYAQQKGSDAELKKKIDTIIETLESREAAQSSKNSDSEKSIEPERLGRRIVPSFTPRAVTRIESEGEVESVKQTEVEKTPEPKVVAVVADTPHEETLPPPVQSVEIEEKTTPLKTVEEHRARIMEIKHRVNTLVGNPAMIMDHGNQIGREYMKALLGALKGTNPGSTHMLGDAMVTLEEAFARILEHVAHPHEESAPEMKIDNAPSQAREPEILEVPPPPEVHTVEPTPVLSPEIDVEPEKEILPEIVETAKPEILSEIQDAVASNAVHEDAVNETGESHVPVAPPHGTASDDTRWTHEGGDVDVTEQIKALREELTERSVQAPEEMRTTRTRTRTRTRIPSIVEMEEEPLPRAYTTGTAWDPYAGKDELSPQALTQRPTSTLTGIMLDTPQSELVSPEVTMALTELLHEWKIFASSGLFGMGPGGVDHPLYIRLARLPMGAVLTGRFEDADMKIVHIIKDYVDAWRHEQGVAYNPTETFEHYLRRVSQRIMKRQKGLIDL